MAVRQPEIAFTEGQHRRIERGVEAIRVCLGVWLPGSAVEIRKRSSDERASTFRILWDKETLTLWVSDEVLDLDAEGATSHLRRFWVSRTLREEGAGKTVAVTTRGVSILPV
jgi:hypothetical protein